MTRSTKTPCRNGFTLVETLVVVAIAGVLLGVLLPAVQSVRHSARKTGCANNLRQIGLAMAGYESANSRFPAGQTYIAYDSPYSYSWAAKILEFLEQQDVVQRIDFQRAFVQGPNHEAASTVIPAFICPATSYRESHRNAEDRLQGESTGVGAGLACTDYLGIAGPAKAAKNNATGLRYGPQRGVLIGRKGLRNESRILVPPAIRNESISDGLSKTACVTECSGRGLDKDGDFHGAWVSGKNISHISKRINSTRPPKAWNKERIYSQHPVGAHFLFCDGATRFLGEDTANPVLEAICSRNGEEPIPAL